MIKNLLCSTALFSGLFFSLAQTTEGTVTSERQNDIMLSPIELIAGPALNFSYERLLNADNGIGVNLAFLLEEADGLRSQISPYYRAYFGKKYASGFFVEGFVPITTSRDTNYSFVIHNSNGNVYSDTQTNTDNNTTFGVGVGFGGKWVAKKNIIFEASLGIARRFGDGNFDEVTGKGMLGIGFRF